MRPESPTWLTLSNNISVRYLQGYMHMADPPYTRVLTVYVNCRPRDDLRGPFDGAIEGDYGVKKKQVKMNLSGDFPSAGFTYLR